MKVLPIWLLLARVPFPRKTSLVHCNVNENQEVDQAIRGALQEMRERFEANGNAQMVAFVADVVDIFAAERQEEEQRKKRIAG